MSRMSTRQAPRARYSSNEAKPKATPAWLLQRGMDGFSGGAKGRWDGGQLHSLLKGVAEDAGLIEGQASEPKKDVTTSRNTVVTQGVKLAELARMRQEHIAQRIDGEVGGASDAMTAPRAFAGYRSKPTMDANARAERGRLATRSFAHFLNGRDAAHLPADRRQQLQRLFSGLMTAMNDSYK